MTHADEWHLSTNLIGRRTLVFPQVDSTNLVAANLATDPSHDGLAVLAHEQTAGRGQQGRTWQCPPGAGVLLSVAIFPPPELRRPVLLTAWAAVAVCETVFDLAGQPMIKWPNDVYFQRKKIAGILIERGTATVAGIGLNLNQSADAFAGLPAATSLALATGQKYDWQSSARLLLEKLDQHYSRLLDGDLATLEASWRGSLGLEGKLVNVECINGEGHTGRLLNCNFREIITLGSDGQRTSIPPESIRRLWPSDL